MNRVLLAAWGSAGDVAPFIGIGRELLRRGHEVTLIALPDFDSAAAEASLAFRPVGSHAVFQQLANPDLWSFDKPLGAEALSFLVRKVPPVRVDEFYHAIRELHRPGETVVVAQKRATGAHIACRDLNVPLAVVELAPSGLPGPSHPPWPLPGWLKRLGGPGRELGRQYVRVRQALERRVRGVSFSHDAVDAATWERVRAWRVEHPEPSAAGAATRRLLGAWPDWFAPADAGADVDLVGFIFQGGGAGAGERGPAGEGGTAGEEAGSKPVVFTTGSVAGSQREFFAAAVAACALVRRPAVFVTRYADQLPRPLPPSVTHLEYAPFDELFPRAGAVVHHGGIGTIALGLAAGVPQIAKPMARDQFDNSDRMERLGVGRVIVEAELEPQRLARVLDAVLSSSAVAERCAHWRARVDRGAGAAAAADAVEALAAER